MADAATKEFSLKRPRYDMDTFYGRFRHFLDVADPRTLAPSMFLGMSLETSVNLIDQYKANGNKVPDGVSLSTMWLARKIKSSTIHPDTNEEILPPFRMAGYAVFGTPMCVGMLIPNPTLASTIFWQSLNQTHNAGVNFSNRNASSKSTVTSLVQGYAGAVTSSVTIAVGLNEIVKRLNVSTATRTMLSRFVAYPAVATASTCNMLLMRRKELETGIDIKDEHGNVLGVSKLAAKEAIYQTMLTRILLPAPLLILPPVSMIAIEKTGMFNKFPRMRLPMEASLCTIAFVFGLPFALALFPQDCERPATDFEPEFHNLKDKDGNPIKIIEFNRGL